jgi:ribonuclease BN (tRNA processing enzyme)
VRLTVIGCGPAAPQPDTAASGLLVESGATAILLDCGPGVASRLSAVRDPRTLGAVVIGHLHADHFLDLVSLRYLLPWEGSAAERLTVVLPPGGGRKLRALAPIVSERDTFFDEAFDIVEHRVGAELHVGDLRIRAVPSRHYVPAWSVEVVDSAGTRIVYVGDTGPYAPLDEFVRGADLIVCEATLASGDDDQSDRGHLAANESLALARRAGAAALLLTHYPSARRPELLGLAAAEDQMAVSVARPGLQLTLGGAPAAPGKAWPAVAADRHSRVPG